MNVGDKWQGVKEKYCDSCGEFRAVEQFFWRPSSLNGKYYPSSDCKTCNQKNRSAYMKERRQDEDYRILQIAKTKGISVYEYNSQLQFQKYQCAICQVTENLEVDHDHSCCDGPGWTCGKCNRGFLCRRCNRMLGMAGDDPALLVKAYNYLLNKGTWERFTDKNF